MKKIATIIAFILSLTVYAEDSIPVLDSIPVVDSLSVDTLAADTLSADSTAATIFEAMPNVTVHQDSIIRDLLLDKALGRELEDTDVQGYRVQIYSSNHQQMAKLEAMRLEKDMQDKIDVPVYVTYTPPFWKVRIGDFATYEDAQEFKNSFVQQFPELLGDTYVVRDQVTLKR